MSEDKRALRRYLWRYLNAKVALEALKKRMKTLSNTPRPELAGVTYQLSECEEQVRDRIQDVERSLMDVLGCLGLLEEGSFERLVLEYKYFYGMSVEDAASSLYISRATFYRLEGKALDQLLTFGYVRDKVQEYKRLEDPPKNKVPGVAPGK